MITIISKLENNIFSDILIKKGKNIISNKKYAVLLENKEFALKMRKGLIFIEAAAAKKEEQKEIKKEIDVESMSYDELKKYVADNNIKAESQKKADLIKAIKEREVK